MMEAKKFDPTHFGEHLDKQNEVLMEAYTSMLHELRKLQVEEEMLMRKLFEAMSVRGLTKQNDGNSNTSNSGGAEHSDKELNAANEEQQGHNFG